MRITVLIPAYNEERTIIELLGRVSRQRIDGVELEVLVVDDGSTDRTAELLDANPRLYGRRIRLPRNCGKGGAVIAGLKQATGDFILFQDADLEYDPADYGRLLRPVVEHGADVVMGSRLIAPELTRVHYFWNKLANRLITLLFNVLHNTTFTDIYCGYFVFRRALVAPEGLVAKRWGQQAELLSKAVSAAEVIYEAPISYHGRTYAAGKKIKARHVIDVVYMIIRARLGI